MKKYDTVVLLSVLVLLYHTVDHHAVPVSYYFSTVIRIVVSYSTVVLVLQ